MVVHPNVWQNARRGPHEGLWHFAISPLVRLPQRATPAERAFFLDPARLVRWVYVGRLSIASAIFLAAVLVWQDALTDTGKLLVASLTFFATLVVTAGSIVYSEFYQRPLRPNFFRLQSVFDLLLVTAVVHVTGSSTSQFAALYILVIATSSLFLPVGGGLLVAALGNVLYGADAFWSVDAPISAAVWLQLGVFATVALGSAWLSAKLKEAGADTEAVLAHVRLQAADVLYNIHSGIITVDGEGRLLYANPAAERLLGMDLDGFVGRPVFGALRAIAPDLVNAVERSVHDRVRTTRAEAVISTVARRFPIGLTTTYTEGDGRNTDRTATVIFQDISDQKRIETLRLRAERLEGVAELSASLAHEIKNPLASIRSACEQLSRSPVTGSDEKTLAQLVMRESDRLSRLLSEFLDFARVRVARREPLDIAHLAAGAMRLALEHPDRPEHVTLTCDARENEFFVEGDEDLLHRAVFNLVLNALQASNERGEVRLEVEAASPDVLDIGNSFAAGGVALSVVDSGKGIPADIRDRMFDPFFTTRQGGSGLGLAVVHRAIDAHRGLVFVDSNASGTRFTIVLPRVAHVVPSVPVIHLSPSSPATALT
jgi:two-component system sensor histidine kinase PilS (NtrC family)